MADVREGRWTARVDGDFVVFLIGARLDWRHPLRSFQDLGGMQGMPVMLKRLAQDPDSGMLGFETYGLTMNVQYWRSFEDLERFANDEDDLHRPVWRTYWKRVGRSGRTGIWHETFLVRDGEFESVYGNMRPHGLARATEVVSLREDASARRRLRRASSQSASDPSSA